MIFQSLVSELSYDINFKLKRDFEDQLHNITLTTGNCLILETLSYVAVIVQEMNELFSFVKEHQTSHDYYSPGNKQFLIWIQGNFTPRAEILACPEIATVKERLIILL